MSLLGYTYQDIQKMGNGLTWAIDNAPDKYQTDLLEIWNFFEGLLAEGYIENE